MELDFKNIFIRIAFKNFMKLTLRNYIWTLHDRNPSIIVSTTYNTSGKGIVFHPKN